MTICLDPCWCADTRTPWIQRPHRICLMRFGDDEEQYDAIRADGSFHMRIRAAHHSLVPANDLQNLADQG